MLHAATGGVCGGVSWTAPFQPTVSLSLLLEERLGVSSPCLIQQGSCVTLASISQDLSMMLNPRGRKVTVLCEPFGATPFPSCVPVRLW